MSWMTRFVGAAVLCGLTALQGCASSPHATATDPYESFNRKMFVFNEEMDARLLRPGAIAYKAILPDFVEKTISNVINNVKDVWSFANLVLQGEGVAAVEGLMRVLVNTTFGLGGMLDVASDMQLDRRNEDLGQTLAVWGAPNGPYLVLPLFGPSTVRDASALPADTYLVPSTFPADVGARNALSMVQLLSVRSQLLGATDLLADVAFDKYSFVRDAYLQRRRNLIYNGNPPEDSDDAGDGSASQSKHETFKAPVTVLWSPNIHVVSHLPVRALPAASAFGARDVNDRDNTPAVVSADEWSAPVVLPELPVQVAQRLSSH
jgi:phospholipid-binding lipoprotein MlaA